MDNIIVDFIVSMVAKCENFVHSTVVEGEDLMMYNFIHLMDHQKYCTDALFVSYVSDWEIPFDIAKGNITLKKECYKKWGM
jgi:hypothetical protein